MLFLFFSKSKLGIIFCDSIYLSLLVISGFIFPNEKYMFSSSIILLLLLEDSEFLIINFFLLGELKQFFLIGKDIFLISILFSNSNIF